MSDTFLEQCLYYGKKLVFPAVFVTLRMIAATMIISSICGFILAIFLTLYGPNGLRHRKNLYQTMSFLVNVIRSFPILILIVAISPLTRLIIGTTIGEKAVILPLSVAATAFIARMLESSFIKVDRQLIEAARSFGATDMQIMFRVIIKESVPSIISVLTIATVTYIAATTIAGAVGGGGLGAISLTYGYQSFNNIVLYMAVAALFVIVNLVQFIGDRLYKKYL